MPGSKHWCFTLNNYNDEEHARLVALGSTPECEYIVIGRETGDSGTPHLQGYVCFVNRKTLASCKRLISDRAHLESARGTPLEASTYCKKDGDYYEHGNVPAGRGKRSDWELLLEFVTTLDRRPTDKELWLKFPGLRGRYQSGIRQMIETFHPLRPAGQGDLREWQSALEARIQDPPDDRKVHFVVDPLGAKGKSWFVRHCLRTREDVQLLKIGKRDDLAFCIDESKKVFLIDVPRNNMQFLQYPVLEMLKDMTVFSPKYESRLKIFTGPVHVFVFCNEHPDMDALTHDRYEIISLSVSRVDNILT